MTTKDKVLEILSQNHNQSVSGEKIASFCGVSRAAIWKAIKTLREEGCKIEGTTNGGYILQGPADVFSKDMLIKYLAEDYPDFAKGNIECFKNIDSTNTYAKKILSECGALRLANGGLSPAGKKYNNSIIVAESQTAGRGRLGRTFVSPSKTGIYLSVIYAPEGGITEPAKLTAFSAVAVKRVIKKLYKIDAKIKWINDIYINGKKVCGILTEGFTNFETGSIESAVIGIGINISDNQDIFNANKSAGSITGKKPDENITRCQLAALVAGETLKIFDEDTASVMMEYRNSSFLIGDKVQVHPIIGDDKAAYFAQVIDIDDKAGLVVQLEDGSRKTLNSGEVSLHSDI